MSIKVVKVNTHWNAISSY